MKKINYKTDKWEKRKIILVENSKYDYEEVELLKKDYLDGKIDEIRYHYTLSLYLKNIAEDEFVQGDFLECYKNIVSSLNEFITSIKLLDEGKKTNQSTKLGIESKVNSGYFGYYALITCNYDVISYITKPNSSIIQMLTNGVVNEGIDKTISEMERAISVKDADKFENALEKRIKEIRKFNLDNYVCADFISIALIKEAKKVGMHFNADYIEVDMKEI